MNKKQIFLWISAFCILAAQAATPDWDFGTSHNLFVKYALDDSWYATSTSTVETLDDASEFWFLLIDATLGRKLDDHWSVDGGYRHVWHKKPATWIEEYRPVLNLNAAYTLEGWDIAARMRTEYRAFETHAIGDRFALRPMLRVVAPWEVTPLSIRPFVEEEAFIQGNDTGFDMNWLSLGLQVRFNSHLVFKPAWRWQERKSGNDWVSGHALVTTLLLSF